MIPLLANRFMMFIELFPFIRKFDFLFGGPTRKLKEAVEREHAMLEEVIELQ